LPLRAYALTLPLIEFALKSVQTDISKQFCIEMYVYTLFKTNSMGKIVRAHIKINFTTTLVDSKNGRGTEEKRGSELGGHVAGPLYKGSCESTGDRKLKHATKKIIVMPKSEHRHDEACIIVFPLHEFSARCTSTETEQNKD